MKYRKLGKLGIEVSEIGFGCWGIGGNKNGAIAYGETDDRQSLAALNAAIENGVTFFDTADLYGFGHSEKLLGQAIKNHRDEVVIASKFGLHESENSYPSKLEKYLDASLARLNTDYIDLYQWHSPNSIQFNRADDYLAVLEKLVEKGKIRAYGISLKSPEDGKTAIEKGFACIQLNFSLLDQRAIEFGIFDLCLQENIGVIVRTPLVFGFLTGEVVGEFDEFDHRRNWSAEQRDLWMNAIQSFDSLLEKKEQTPAQFALRYCLSESAVSTTIPGMLTIEHVLENTKASELGALSFSERCEVEKIYCQSEFFVTT